MTPLDIAISQIGYTEGKNNSTKYGAWYGLNNQPWCMMFVQWCFAMANCPLPFKSASCADTLQWYKAYYPNDVTLTPKPNDIVIYTFGHTGIVERSEGNYIIAIEGNTSPTTSGAQANGDGVYRRMRAKTLVKAYIRPRVEQESDYMTKDEILKELGDQYIHTYSELPQWAKAPIRKLLDEGIINGGTDASVDPDDINMYLSDIKTIVIIERMLEKLK